MRLREDLELKRLVEEDLMNRVQEKQLELCERAKIAIEKIQREPY